MVVEILLGIPAIGTEIFSAPISHSAKVRVTIEEIVVDMIMLDDLSDMCIYREGFQFPVGEKQNAVCDLLAYAADSHKAVSGIPVFQTEKDIEIQVS